MFKGQGLGPAGTVVLCEVTKPLTRQPRGHTVYQDHRQCAGVNIIRSLKCSVVTLFCRARLMVEADHKEDDRAMKQQRPDCVT
jgi:hypothetical protein